MVVNWMAMFALAMEFEVIDRRVAMFVMFGRSGHPVAMKLVGVMVVACAMHRPMCVWMRLVCVALVPVVVMPELMC